MEELRKRHAAWCTSLERAVQTDGWGQVIEAVEAYERLAMKLTEALADCHHLSRPQKQTIEKVAGSLELRAKSLSSVDGELSSPTKEDMEDILIVLQTALSDEPAVLPMDFNVASPSKKASTVQVVEETDLDEMLLAEEEVKKKMTIPRRPGATYIDIFIDKIGLKDANVYVNPTVGVSIFDRDGKAMEALQETTVGAYNEPQHVGFKSQIQLATSLQSMEERGAAIFFEFFHYKPKKRKKSCRCWTLLELDELSKSGPLVLELYEKPMDPKRKRIHLFTIKELYLHIDLRLLKM